MNEQLQAALAKIVNTSITGVDAATSFLSKQLPDVIHQLIMWKIAQNLLQVGLFLVFMVILWMLHRIYSNAKKGGVLVDKYGDATLGAIALWIILGVLTVVFFVVAIFAISNITELIIAPKIYLMEYVASLAHGAK